MKLNFKILSVLGVSALTLTGCIDETFPESSTVTEGQVTSSATSLQASIAGIPAQMSEGYYVYGTQSYEYDMSYPGFMIMQTEMLGSMFAGSNYDHYETFNASYGASSTSAPAYLTWYTLYKYVKAANDIIAMTKAYGDDISDEAKVIEAEAYAFRAFDYYFLTVLFEPVENIYTDCSKVLGLTVPIVTEETTEDIAKNNPRVSHDEMIAFILSDLDKAESVLIDHTPDSKLFPDISVVYGLKAKTYLWDKDYVNAAKYARLAISASGATPVTEEQWLNLSTGFNTSNQAWMWYISYTAETMGNLCNFIGWMSGENDWGYASLTQPQIDRSLYDYMASSDFRKHAFLDPEKYDYYSYQTCRDQAFIESAPDYMSLKFRCCGGNWETYTVGGAAQIPVMRVEEMYFIEALAVGESQGAEAGAALLNSFMRNYRQSNYNFAATEVRDLELEVYKQMAIEFWGEGNAFPVAKLIKPDVIQNYEGTNAPDNYTKINCKGIKPNWNFCIPIYEVQANPALEGYNNPDATALVKGPTAIGEFAPGYADTSTDETSKK